MNKVSLVSVLGRSLEPVRRAAKRRASRRTSEIIKYWNSTHLYSAFAAGQTARLRPPLDLLILRASCVAHGHGRLWRDGKAHHPVLPIHRDARTHRRRLHRAILILIAVLVVLLLRVRRHLRAIHRRRHVRLLRLHLAVLEVVDGRQRRRVVRGRVAVGLGGVVVMAVGGVRLHAVHVLLHAGLRVRVQLAHLFLVVGHHFLRPSALARVSPTAVHPPEAANLAVRE